MIARRLSEGFGRSQVRRWLILILFNGELCRAKLMQWSRDINPNKLIDRTHKRLIELQRGPLTEEVKTEIAGLTRQLEKLYIDQSEYWRRRGKAAWFKDGDKNTSYFHARATVGKQVNKIKGLENENGQWVKEKHALEGVVDSYFRELFHSTRPYEGDMEAVLQEVAPRLSEEDAHLLSQPFTDIEVKEAISSMSPLKSPSLDGYRALFYQKYWHIIGSSVISCVLNFLSNRVLPSELNYTYIVLIPKVKHPKKKK